MPGRSGISGAEWWKGPTIVDDFIKLAADAIAKRPSQWRRLGRPSGPLGRRGSTRAWTAGTAWSANTTTVSTSAVRPALPPPARLFTDKVDEVWDPMESLYPPEKKAVDSRIVGLPDF